MLLTLRGFYCQKDLTLKSKSTKTETALELVETFIQSQFSYTSLVWSNVNLLQLLRYL